MRFKNRSWIYSVGKWLCSMRMSVNGLRKVRNSVLNKKFVNVLSGLIRGLRVCGNVYLVSVLKFSNRMKLKYMLYYVVIGSKRMFLLVNKCRIVGNCKMN